MLKHLRRLAVTAAVLVSVVIPLAPSPAAAAAELIYPGQLGRWWPGGAGKGTGTIPMKNSAGQKIGEYELTAVYYHGSGPDGSKKYSLEMMVCVRDTLANGRGVIARVLLKYGTNSSYEVVKAKDGSSCGTSWYPSIAYPVWAVDVDHGETWAGTPYQYTGNFNRYANIGNINVQYPSFHYCDNPVACGPA